MKTTNRTHLLVVAFSMIAAFAVAQDWPQWRGANRDAKATDFKAPAKWPKELTKKWRTTVGDGVATPALAGDRLYVFTRQEGYEILRCLNASDGKEAWQDKYESLGASGAAQSFSGPRSSPTVASGKVVTIGVRGVISCIDAASGKMIWRKDDFKTWPRFFPSSSPIIMNNLVIAQLGGQQNGALVAYDLASGDEKWKWTGESPGYASPDVMTVGDTKLIFAETEQRIVAVNSADGKLVWETPYTVQGRGYNASTPIVNGQTLIYCGSGRGTKAVKIQKEGDKFVAKELWSNPEKSVQFNTPVVKNGVIYGLTGNNEFFCLNQNDGKTLWSAPGPGAPDAGPRQPGGARPPAAGQVAPAERPAPGGAGAQPSPRPGGPGGRRGGGGMMGGGGGYGSIVDAGSVLLALTPSSQLVVFEPNDKEFKQIATYKVADSPTHAYPVASGNRLFIKDRDSVTLWTVE
jgi:outer membrane protein assembly factor BamB